MRISKMQSKRQVPRLDLELTREQADGLLKRLNQGAMDGETDQGRTVLIIDDIELDLAESEAREFADTLEKLLLAKPGKSHHEHVASEDYSAEVTVWVKPDSP